jgi:hypothetical protein
MASERDNIKAATWSSDFSHIIKQKDEPSG